MSAQVLDSPAARRHQSPLPRRIAVPRTTTTVLVAAAVIASLAPSLLPRSSLTQAIVTGVAASLGLALSAILFRVTNRVSTPSIHPRTRLIALAGGTVAILAAAMLDARWQNSLRAAMASEPTSPMHWVEVLYGSISICAILVVIGVGIARGARRLGRTNTAVLLIVSVLSGYFLVLPATWSPFATQSASAGASMDTSLSLPQSSGRSGSRDSLIDWNSLGREGRKFVTGGDDGSAVRTYVALDADPVLLTRARIAVDELQRSGGFAKSHVVVAVPTGSGWVDENAVTGIEDRFDGDVATVALQYSYQPSWVTFLFAKSEATEAARAVLDAVRTRIAELPAAARPDLYVYGQSLGSIGGSAAVAEDRAAICGTLWAGPPAGEVETGAAVVLANSSDPVVRWSTELLTSPPNLDGVRVDAPMPQWIPVISYLQTTVDMVSALDAPAGHGHRYGQDQGTLLPNC